MKCCKRMLDHLDLKYHWLCFMDKYLSFYEETWSFIFGLIFGFLLGFLFTFIVFMYIITRG